MGEILPQLGETVHGDPVLARERPQRKQALLDMLELPWVQIGVGQRPVEQSLRLDRLRQRPVERGDGGIEAAVHLVGNALQLSQRRAQGIDDAPLPATAGKLGRRVAERLG